MAQKFPIVTLTGPRQSGKTTISKMAFPEYRYVSLENPDNLSFAQNDPRGFLNLYEKHVIIDEAQNAPELFSYIQQVVDESGIVGQYILSGSQNFLMLEKITQSLAGRVYILNLLPLSYEELKEVKTPTIGEAIFKGGYPRIYDKDIHPRDFFPSYISTYIERDVRSILNIQNLSTFRKFISLCAGFAGQLWNANSISKKLSIDVKTVQNWLSVLEASYIVFTLKPWHRNLSKRIIKSPKLYFYDTGLLSYLLGIEDSEAWVTSPYKGALFENYMLVEILKNHYNEGRATPFYFWRDSNGNEVDLIIEHGEKVKCIEFKASETIKPEFIQTLRYFENLDTDYSFSYFLVNSGNVTQYRTHETILSWKDSSKIIPHR